MKKKINGAFATLVVIAFAAVVLYYGFYWMNGGPNADVTQQNIEHWKNAAKNYKAPPKGSYTPGRPPNVPASTGKAGKEASESGTATGK